MGENTLGLKELKIKYNKVLEREKKAEEYFNRTDVSGTEKEKWLPKLNDIIVELSRMMKEHKKLTGEEMSKQEVLEGFKDGI